MKIAVVVGNPKAGSRTLEIASALSARFVDAAPGAQVVTVDLAEFAGHLFEWPHPEVDSLIAAVAESDLLIVASPTYKATYTGLLKAFLDRYGSDGLKGTTAIPLMTAGSDLHGLAPEVHLRPLLVELGSSVPTRGLFFVMSKYEQLDEVIDNWFIAHWPVLARVLPAASAKDTTP